MEENRKIRKVFKSRPTIEGAGVHLRRVFGNSEVPLFDPFLLLDDFRNTDPYQYIKGFPWHPHRGIETITYVLQGDVEHGDSMGNKGVITSGDMQWMTAGSGIIHQEMPKGDDGRRDGRFSTLGESSEVAQDDGPPVPRHQKLAGAGGGDEERRHGQGHLRDRGGKDGPGHGHRHRSRISRRHGAGPFRVRPQDHARPHGLRLRDQGQRASSATKRTPMPTTPWARTISTWSAIPTSTMERRSSSTTATR